MNYPEEFNLNDYRNNNLDLKDIPDDKLFDHYYSKGQYEGRQCNIISNRHVFFNLINSNLKILEIGPLDRPIFSKQSYNVKYLDYFSKSELVESYKNNESTIIDNICEVDYVVKDTSYIEKINEKFDIVVSSHNIEHSPCLITFLNNIYDVLADDGRLFLAIPDYRFCFDTFRNESNIFDILYAYYNKISHPTIINVLESKFYTTHNDSVKHWNNFLNKDNIKIKNERLCFLN